MRIDYSEPKKSYVSNQGGSRPRKESMGLFPVALIVTAVLTFGAGFGTGWHFSQKAAKKSFQAATEQNSLENAKKEAVAPKQQPPAPPVASSQLQTPTQPNQPAAAAVPQTPPGEVPLSFFKSLPSGQKGAALGSGINKDEGAKVPLQAPMPAGTTKQSAAEARSTDKPASDKGTAKSAEASGFTVQVASYPLRSEAETLKNSLSGKGYNVYISESHLGDKGTWYRVRVGRRMEQEAARELAKKLGKSAQVFPEKE